jgi:hypothetical protein
VQLPRFLIRLIDPAQGYFDQQHGRRRSRELVHREAVVFGPGVPGGSRAPTADELADLRRTAARHRADHEAAVADARVRWAVELRQAADELLAGGATRLRLGDRTIDARIVSFWRGDDVLHITETGPNEGAEAISRISQLQRTADVLLDHLTRAAGKPQRSDRQGRNAGSSAAIRAAWSYGRVVLAITTIPRPSSG